MATVTERLEAATAAHEAAAIQMQALLDALDSAALWMELGDAGQPAQTVESDVVTRANNMVVTGGSIPASQWDGSLFTVAPGQGGLWILCNRLNILGDIEETKSFEINGAEQFRTSLTAEAGNGNVTMATLPIHLNDGDIVAFNYSHSAGATRTSLDNRATLMRVS